MSIFSAETETRPAGDPLPIIDTHQHLWDLGRFRLAWLRDYGPLRRNYLLEDYWQAAQGTNIVKTIYMEVDVVPEQREAEVDYVVAMAKEPDARMAGAVVGGAPESEQFAAYVRRLKMFPQVKGLRAALRSQPSDGGFELDKAFVAGVRLLGEQGLSFDINVQPAQLDQAAALVDRAPDTRYILDHCGNVNVTSGAADIERWKRGMADVARRQQAVCKVSGFITNARGHKPTQEEIAGVVDHVLECFGPDRVIFASDWPVSTLAMSLHEWIAAVQQAVADRSEPDRRKLFHDNAVRIYGL
jgi:predicted TIM-barrel fold metal-dependent hydrolase